MLFLSLITIPALFLAPQTSSARADSVLHYMVTWSSETTIHPPKGSDLKARKEQEFGVAGFSMRMHPDSDGGGSLLFTIDSFRVRRTGDAELLNAGEELDQIRAEGWGSRPSLEGQVHEVKLKDGRLDLMELLTRDSSLLRDSRIVTIAGHLPRLFQKFPTGVEPGHRWADTSDGKVRKESSPFSGASSITAWLLDSIGPDGSQYFSGQCCALFDGTEVVFRVTTPDQRYDNAVKMDSLSGRYAVRVIPGQPALEYLVETGNTARSELSFDGEYFPNVMSIHIVQRIVRVDPGTGKPLSGVIKPDR